MRKPPMQCIEGFFTRIIMRVKVAWIVTRTLSLGQEPFVKITKTVGAEDGAARQDFPLSDPPVRCLPHAQTTALARPMGQATARAASLRSGLARGSLRARLRHRAAGPDVGPPEGRND